MQQHMTKTGRNASGLLSRAAFALHSAAMLQSVVVGFVGFTTRHVSNPMLSSYGFCGKNWKHEQRIRGEFPLVANG
jgi:hypothetical protein